MTERVPLDDAELAVEVEGQGEPILMIQGVGVAGCAWRPQVAALSRRWRCITYDHRGVGRSTGTLKRLSIAGMADDALAILDALELARVHVVGHSMGGVVAQQLALTAPGRVRSLALLCTFSRGREAARPSWPMLRWGIPSVIGTRRSRARAMAHLIVSNTERAAIGTDGAIAVLGQAFGRPLATPPAASRRQLRALARHDAYDRLPELATIPTLVLSAAEDRIAPPSRGRRLAAAIGNARYHELPGTSHACTIMAATDVNEVLTAHFVRADGDVRGRAVHT